MTPERKEELQGKVIEALREEAEIQHFKPKAKPMVPFLKKVWDSPLSFFLFFLVVMTVSYFAGQLSVSPPKVEWFAYRCVMQRGEVKFSIDADKKFSYYCEVPDEQTDSALQ